MLSRIKEIFDRAKSLESLDSTFPDNDLDIALMFYEVMNTSIVLVVDSISHAPYVKRGVMKVLGVPNRIMGNDLRYEEHTIRIVTESQPTALVGHREHTIFYIETWRDYNYV